MNQRLNFGLGIKMKVDYDKIFSSENPLNLIIRKKILNTSTLNVAVFKNKVNLVKKLIDCGVIINRTTCKNVQSVEMMIIINKNVIEKRLITSSVGFYDNEILEFIGKKKLTGVDVSLINGHELAMDAIISHNKERLKIVLRYFTIYKNSDDEDIFFRAVESKNLDLMELVVRFGKRRHSEMSREMQLAICDAYYSIKNRLCQKSTIAASDIKERLVKLNCKNVLECFKKIQEEGLHEEYSKVVGLDEKKMKENTLKLINEINNSL